VKYLTLLGGEAGMRVARTLRLEGTESAVADGDVIHFWFAT
jgi:ribosome-binding ATPase YchF (GTP1/OBG family)